MYWLKIKKKFNGFTFKWKNNKILKFEFIISLNISLRMDHYSINCSNIKKKKKQLI